MAGRVAEVGADGASGERVGAPSVREMSLQHITEQKITLDSGLALSGIGETTGLACYVFPVIAVSGHWVPPPFCHSWSLHNAPYPNHSQIRNWPASGKIYDK